MGQAQPAYAGVAFPVMTVRRYAGFWMRFWAMLIDGLILGIPTGILQFLLWTMLGLSFPTVPPFGSGEEAVVMFAGVTNLANLLGAITTISLASFVIHWLYFSLMESSGMQATLGKAALGIRVTDLMGQRLTFARATGRFLAKIVSGMTLTIGYIMAGFTARKQALHDLIAGTLVWRDN